MSKHKKIGIAVLLIIALGFIGLYFYSSRWRKFTDNNFIGNQTFGGGVGFVTDYDPGLAAGDTIEIKQEDNRRRKEEYEGKAEVVGITKNADNNFVIVTNKGWAGSTPKIGGSWRKLNII